MFLNHKECVVDGQIWKRDFWVYYKSYKNSRVFKFCAYTFLIWHVKQKEAKRTIIWYLYKGHFTKILRAEWLWTSLSLLSLKINKKIQMS